MPPLVALVICVWLTDVWVLKPGVVFDPSVSTQIAEAAAWWTGRLDLLDTHARFAWDTAVVEGKRYSHFPPLFTVIAFVLFPIFGGVPRLILVFGVFVPMLWLAYALFLRRTHSRWFAAVLVVGLVGGTSLVVLLDKMFRGASAYDVNHVLAVLGLLVFLSEYFGRRRVWLAGLGLIASSMARQLTAAYVFPLIYMAWRGGAGDRRPRRVLEAGLVTAVMLAVPMVFNTAKFGGPFETGYMLIYQGRDDRLAQDAHQHGLFSPHFVPRNLYHMNLGFPNVGLIEIAGEEEFYYRPNFKGTGIWWTTPVLLWLFVAVREWWQDRRCTALAISVLGVYGALMMFHNTGYEQRGINRFSMDFIPVVLAMVAPAAVAGRRRWITLALVVWSVAYFRWYT